MRGARPGVDRLHEREDRVEQRAAALALDDRGVDQRGAAARVGEQRQRDVGLQHAAAGVVDDVLRALLADLDLVRARREREVERHAVVADVEVVRVELRDVGARRGHVDVHRPRC